MEDGSRETESYNFGPIERVLGWPEGAIDTMLADGSQPTPTASHARYEEAVETLGDIADAVRSKYSDRTVRQAVQDLIEIWERGPIGRASDPPAEPERRLDAS